MVNRFETARLPESVPELQSSDIFVDEEGEWFNEGIPISREDIVQFFLEHVQELPDGTFAIVWGGCRCGFRAADTPFVVNRVDWSGGADTGTGRVLLKLRHVPEPVTLDPGTLVSASNNVLYCRIREGRCRARFSRPAYYQLAQWIEEDEATGGFCLNVGDQRFTIRVE
jgi:hypothetical protein